MDETSFPLHYYGGPHGYIHDLRNTYQRGLHFHLPLSTFGIPFPVSGVLAAGPRELHHWESLHQGEYFPSFLRHGVFLLTRSIFIKGAGGSLFVASLLGFYLLIVQLFESIGFPCFLPVGDLATLWDRDQKR